MVSLKGTFWGTDQKKLYAKMPSPFLTPGTRSQPDTLALLHLRRDQTIPTILRIHDDENQGYKEGKVTTTRFGSYPHSTLLDEPWGTQIVASKVDTGSRGRRPPFQQQPALKRKAADLDNNNTTSAENSTKEEEGARPQPKAAVAASSGFCHMLYPTPETWTASLPHRTQVVYTPDYSYILHRLRVRAGSTIIEAGAGSGSFTHASARAVFNGYPSVPSPTPKRRRFGKVCSFEFHEQRAGRIRQEVQEHGLEGIVEVTHRDVYADGFLLGTGESASSPKANAVFLDLPAPWLALKHLVRNPTGENAVSPLDPQSPVYICTFSPCLEQVQRTISALRQHGWLSIEMVEINHRRLEVRRERYGLESEGIRGATVFPKSVEEAIAKMRSVEERARRFREVEVDPNGSQQQQQQQPQEEQQKEVEMEVQPEPAEQPNPIPTYSQGRVVHRTEQDLKIHTSYLVFAVLPREWTEADEQKCREQWPSQKIDASVPGEGQKSKKQMKREAKDRRNKQEAA